MALRNPTGTTVDIVGTAASDKSCSCINHKCCGEVLKEDVVVRIKAVQIKVDGNEETAMSVVHVTGGVDSCRVGFLRHFMVKHKDEYDGLLCQIIDILDEKSESPSDRAKVHRNKGYCRAVLIDAEFATDSPRKR
eukprot:scaffold1634_cov137-Amphora_coffeaeformis.AAC.4